MPEPHHPSQMRLHRRPQRIRAPRRVGLESQVRLRQSNSQIGQTFYDFVNGYRIREVQRRIRAGEARAKKMLALAMDAGFASKSTFNQAFKKHTSQTPSDFRQAIGA